MQHGDYVNNTVIYLKLAKRVDLKSPRHRKKERRKEEKKRERERKSKRGDRGRKGRRMEIVSTRDDGYGN